MSALFGVPVDAAYHLVYALTAVATPILGGLAAVAAIVVFTMAARLLVMPLSFRALRGQAAQARLAPQVQALRKRHARQPERLQRELTALYQREGTSVFAGFAPLLAQWPVFSVLYLLFRSPVVAGGPNRMLSRDLFGVPLGDHWLSGAGPLSAQGAVFLGVLALLAAACWLSVRVARRMSATGPAPATPTGTKPARTKPARTKPARTKPTAIPSEAALPTGTGGALGAALKALPYLTVVIAAFAPLAAAVYLVVSTGWSVAERWAFARSRHEARHEARSRHKERREARDRHEARELTGAPPPAGHTLRERGH